MRVHHVECIHEGRLTKCRGNRPDEPAPELADIVAHERVLDDREPPAHLGRGIAAQRDVFFRREVIGRRRDGRLRRRTQREREQQEHQRKTVQSNDTWNCHCTVVPMQTHYQRLR